MGYLIIMMVVVFRILHDYGRIGIPYKESNQIIIVVTFAGTEQKRESLLSL